jgi:ABC-2 type transport system permease protein
MIGYFSYFKTQVINGLQYKTAAFAGVLTQIFWGMLNTLVFVAFYRNVSNNTDISLSQLITYIWLNQAFLALIYVRTKDDDILKSIKNGTVAYELCRPYNLYTWWYIKLLSKKYSAVILRFLPIIILGFILPKPYNLCLPYSISNFVLFFISLILGSLLLTSITMIIQSIAFFTNEGKGISDIIYLFADIFAGSIIPLPLMPKVVQALGNYLPFRFIGDLAFRVYSGNITSSYAVYAIVIQVIWLFVLVIVGQFIMRVALRKVCIQGG